MPEPVYYYGVRGRFFGFADMVPAVLVQYKLEHETPTQLFLTKVLENPDVPQSRPRRFWKATGDDAKHFAAEDKKAPAEGPSCVYTTPEKAILVYLYETVREVSSNFSRLRDAIAKGADAVALAERNGLSLPQSGTVLDWLLYPPECIDKRPKK